MDFLDNSKPPSCEESNAHLDLDSGLQIFSCCSVISKATMIERARQHFGTSSWDEVQEAAMIARARQHSVTSSWDEVQEAVNDRTPKLSFWTHSSFAMWKEVATEYGWFVEDVAGPALKSEYIRPANTLRWSYADTAYLDPENLDPEIRFLSTLWSYADPAYLDPEIRYLPRYENPQKWSCDAKERFKEISQLRRHRRKSQRELVLQLLLESLPLANGEDDEKCAAFHSLVTQRQLLLFAKYQQEKQERRQKQRKLQKLRLLEQQLQQLNEELSRQLLKQLVQLEQATRQQSESRHQLQQQQQQHRRWLHQLLSLTEQQLQQYVQEHGQQLPQPLLQNKEQLLQALKEKQARQQNWSTLQERPRLPEQQLNRQFTQQLHKQESINESQQVSQQQHQQLHLQPEQGQEAGLEQLHQLQQLTKKLLQVLAELQSTKLSCQPEDKDQPLWLDQHFCELERQTLTMEKLQKLQQLVQQVQQLSEKLQFSQPVHQPHEKESINESQQVGQQQQQQQHQHHHQQVHLQPEQGQETDVEQLRQLQQLTKQLLQVSELHSTKLSCQPEDEMPWVTQPDQRFNKLERQEEKLQKLQQLAEQVQKLLAKLQSLQPANQPHEEDLINESQQASQQQHQQLHLQPHQGQAGPEQLHQLQQLTKKLLQVSELQSTKLSCQPEDEDELPWVIQRDQDFDKSEKLQKARRLAEQIQQLSEKLRPSRLAHHPHEEESINESQQVGQQQQQQQEVGVDQLHQLQQLTQQLLQAAAELPSTQLSCKPKDEDELPWVTRLNQRFDKLEKQEIKMEKLQRLQELVEPVQELLEKLQSLQPANQPHEEEAISESQQVGQQQHQQSHLQPKQGLEVGVEQLHQLHQWREQFLQVLAELPQPSSQHVDEDQWLTQLEEFKSPKVSEQTLQKLQQLAQETQHLLEKLQSSQLAHQPHNEASMNESQQVGQQQHQQFHLQPKQGKAGSVEQLHRLQQLTEQLLQALAELQSPQLPYQHVDEDELPGVTHIDNFFDSKLEQHQKAKQLVQRLPEEIQQLLETLQSSQPAHQPHNEELLVTGCKVTSDGLLGTTQFESASLDIFKTQRPSIHEGALRINDTSESRAVAVKIFEQQEHQQEELNAIRALSKTDQGANNIVSYILHGGDGEVPAPYLIVMDYIELNLVDYFQLDDRKDPVTSECLPFDAVDLSLMKGVCSALQALKDCGLMLTALKMTDIMIDTSTEKGSRQYHSRLTLGQCTRAPMQPSTRDFGTVLYGTILKKDVQMPAHLAVTEAGVPPNFMIEAGVPPVLLSVVKECWSVGCSFERVATMLNKVSLDAL